MRCRRLVVCLAGALLFIAAPALAEPAVPPTPPAGFQIAKPQSGLYSLSVPADWKVTPALNGDGLSAKSPDEKVDLLCGVDQKKSTLDAFADESARMATGILGLKEVSRRPVRISGYPGLRLELSGNERQVGFFVITDANRLMLLLSCPEADKQAWEPVLTKVAESWQIGAGPPPPPVLVPPGPQPPPQPAPQPPPVFPQPQPAPQPWPVPQPPPVVPQPQPAPPPWPVPQPPPVVPQPQPVLPQPGPVPPPAGLLIVKPQSGLYSLSVPADWQIDPPQNRDDLSAASRTSGKLGLLCTVDQEKRNPEARADAIARAMKEKHGMTEASRRQVRISGYPGLRLALSGGNTGLFEIIYIVAADPNTLTLILTCAVADQLVWEPALTKIAESLQIGGAPPAVVQPMPVPQPQPLVPQPPPQPWPAPQPPPLVPQPQPAPLIPQPQPMPQPWPVPTPAPLVPLPQPTPQPWPAPPPQPPPGPVALKELHEPTGMFSLSVPSDWQGQEMANAVSATAPNFKATLQVAAVPSVPTVSFQQFVQTLVQGAQANPGWTQVGQQQAVLLGGRPAVEIRAESQLAGLSMGYAYVVCDAGQRVLVVQFTYSKEEAQQYEGLFAQILASFRLAGGAQPAPPFQPQPAPAPPFQPGVPSATRQITDPGGAFTITVPVDWQVADGGVAAQDPTRRAAMMVTTAPRQAASLEQFTQSMIGVWRRQVRGWQQVGIQNFQISGRPAAYIRGTGTPNGVRMVADYFLVLTNDRQIMLMVSCSQQDLPQWQALFQQIVQSFQVH